jgi:protein involved in polysaccharide export with SLBB domain
MSLRWGAVGSLSLTMLLSVGLWSAFASDDPPAQKPDTSVPKSGAEPAPQRLYPRPETIKPKPLAPIPDDPPPHEGAMIDLPYVIEPPDLIVVEVLEALPGRPITGERLVRPDGTISLGFYGEVNVRGLTVTQVKEKVVLTLVKILPHEVLGLVEVGIGNDPEDPYEPGPAAGPPNSRELPALPPGGRGFELDPLPKPEPPKSDQAKPKAKPSGFRQDLTPFNRRSPRRPAGVPAVAPRDGRTTIPVALRSVEDDAPVALQVPAGGNLTITIQIHGAEKKPEPKPEPPAPEIDPSKIHQISPAETNRVFVDVTAYNSKFYLVQGDVAAPGRLPVTGHETVLDAINFAGGFVTTADPKNIRLNRPARGGKPAKVYPVDYEAIIRGDATKNYQLFPGDRLVIGRNETITATIHVDRQATVYQSLVNSLLQAALMTRALTQATPDLTQPQREALVKEWFDLWWKSSVKPGGPVPDEATLRELFLKQLKKPEGAEPKETSPKK